MSAANVVIAPQPLTGFIAAIARAAGSSAREAELVSVNLVRANLSGHDSHGVGMMAWYIDFIGTRGLAPNQHAKLTGEFGSMLMLDGQRGYGQVVAYEAMEQGIARAQQAGMALVALRNAHHIGRIGHWAEQCAAAGLVSIHFVNALMRPLVAPYAGADARFTTNPFCVCVPRAGQPPLLLDFATSKVALGKVRVAMQAEKQLAPGTLIDGAGNPTTDPNVMFEADAAGRLGAILPFGDYKGYGMALVCEILGGALTGGETLHDSAPASGITNNMLSIIIDPGRLGGAKHREQMESFIAWVKQSPVAPGYDQVRISGEPELEMRAKRAAGVPIDVNTWSDLQKAAAQAGMSADAVQEFTRQARPE